MTQQKNNRDRWAIGNIGLVLVLAGIVLIAGFYILKDSSISSQISAEIYGKQAAPVYDENDVRVLSKSQWEKILESSELTKGREDARVVMVEFTDYQCPYCAKHFRESEARIQEKFLETNKIRYIKYDLPLSFHSNAHEAAQAARCAGDQDQYWEMHEQLFDTQKSWRNGNPESEFQELAQLIGLDTTEFINCLTSGKYKNAVDKHLELAREVGVGGTPVFFINGKELFGALPYSDFETAITEALGE